MSAKPFVILMLLAAELLMSGCDSYFRNDYKDNSPTSGKLRVYYDEGLDLHVKNQAATFTSLYPNTSLELFAATDDEAVQALYADSCEAIVISRPLNTQEVAAFASKKFSPRYSVVAVSAVALLTSSATAIDNLAYEEVTGILGAAASVADTNGTLLQPKVLLDKANSSVTHYLKDSVLLGKNFSPNCNLLSSSLEALAYTASHNNVIAFIDFAWLSDTDDSLYKHYLPQVKFLRVNKPGSVQYDFPHQSSLKLGTYPFSRKIYIYRKTGDFTLAKGFESFVAGPKGQRIFLKQGLLPLRQPGREIHATTTSPQEND